MSPDFITRGSIIPARSWGFNAMQPSSLYRWDELALEKVAEMISRKIVTGEREMLAQVYLKKGALVPCTPTRVSRLPTCCRER